MPLFMLMAVKTTELRMSEVNIHNINYFKGAYACAVNSVRQARIDVLNAIKELVMSVEGQKIEGLESRLLSYDVFDEDVCACKHYVIEGIYYDEAKSTCYVKIHGYDGVKKVKFEEGNMSDVSVFTLLNLCIRNAEKNNLKFVK